MPTNEALKPHLIERFKVDSSNIRSIGYDGATCVIEFSSGDLFAYPMLQVEFNRVRGGGVEGALLRGEHQGQAVRHEADGRVPEVRIRAGGHRGNLLGLRRGVGGAGGVEARSEADGGAVTAADKAMIVAYTVAVFGVGFSAGVLFVTVVNFWYKL